MEIETIISNIYEEIETTLFYNNNLLDIISNILEEMQQAYEQEDINAINFENFYIGFEWIIENDFEDKTKWILLQNYAEISTLKTVDFNKILQEFYNDIRQIFDKLGE